MEGKKLNIEFAENLEPYCSDETLWDHYDNQHGPLNNLEKSEDKENLQQKECQINELKAKLMEQEMKASLFEDKENLYKDKLKFKDDIIETLKLAIDSAKNDSNNNSASSFTKEKTDQMLELLKVGNEEISLKAKDEEIMKLKSQIKLKNLELTTNKEKLDKKIELLKKYESFRTTVMKIRSTIYIKVEYGGNKLTMCVPKLVPFEPVLDHTIAGTGWIVIQRRTNGSTDFEKKLEDYYEGFGKNKDDFWLGLERLHRITTHQQHELYIHIVDYDGKTHYAKYDNFVVGSKEEKYILKSLGRYSGNANDMMRLNENRVFAVGTTSFKNGWWWLDYATPSCNLNGKYSKCMVTNQEYLFWGLKTWGNRGNFIQSVQMLIRPKK